MPTYSFYLRDSDADLITALEAEPNQCEAVRRALRSYYANEDRVLTELREIKAMLTTGVKPELASDDQVDASVIDEAMKEW